MIRNESSIFKCHGVGIAARAPHTRKTLQEGVLEASDDSASKDGLQHQHVVVGSRADAASNCDEHSYDQEEEESSSEMGEEKLPFSKLARSPVRWTDLHKQKRAVSPMAAGRKRTPGAKHNPWKATINRFTIEREAQCLKVPASKADQTASEKSVSDRDHPRRTEKSRGFMTATARLNIHGAKQEQSRSETEKQEASSTTPRESRAQANQNIRRRYRKLSFSNDEEEDQELEVRSALAASSCSGHEIQSSCSDEGDCSQSDISLCDDVGSEEEGEGDHILGHLEGRARHETHDEAMRSGESYECEDSEGSSLLQHAKNSLNSDLRAQLRSTDSYKMSEQDEGETDWNFNDFFEFAEQDSQINLKSSVEKDSLAPKIRFYPSNGQRTVKEYQKKCFKIEEAKCNSPEASDAPAATKVPEAQPKKTTSPQQTSANAEKSKTSMCSSYHCGSSMSEIEDLQEHQIFEQQSSCAQISDGATIKPQKQTVTSILGKRLRMNETKSIDQQWNELLGENSSDSANEVSMSPGTNNSFLGCPEPAEDSLLGRFMKRQRVNSAATKFEFSFNPTFKPTTSPNADQNNNASAPMPSTSPFSFAPKAATRPRDLKAADKLDCSLSASALPKKASDCTLPKVHIHVSGLFDDSNQEARVPNQNQRQPRRQTPEPKTIIPQGSACSSPDSEMVFQVTKNDDDMSGRTCEGERILGKSAKSSNAKNPTFSAKRDLKPSGLRDRANQLVAHFGGECLTDKKLSVVKGVEAFKFKCIQGHVFYKYVTELQQMKLEIGLRKISKQTASSSSGLSSQSSLEEDIFTTSRHISGSSSSSLAGLWCPKCESFYKSAEIVAKNCSFTLCGDMYEKNLLLKCLKAKHQTALSYSRRLQGNMKCNGCRKDEREAVKQRLREEERLQDAYYTQMQEQMFAEARRDMEKEIASGRSYSFMQTGPAFMDETQRQRIIDQQIAQIAQVAQVQAQSFLMNQAQPAKVTEEQSNVVYTYLNTPAEMLQARMSSMQPQVLIQFYRKLAIQLHPDKNMHPQATDAFQVVQAAYESAKTAMRNTSGAF